MRRPFPLALLGLLLAVPALQAQLPLISTPKGALRIELGGGFFPADRQWVAGTRQPIGGLLTTSSLGAAQTPLVADLANRLTELTGQAPGVISLGGISATAEYEHGVGSIGLGIGLTSRVSLFTTIPIVMLRSRYQSMYDTTGATVGLNPSHPSLGDAAGQNQTSAFFTQFDAALSSLSANVANGAYNADPTTLALAQRTLSDASTLRSGLFSLLMDPAHASPVLPTASSPDGAALLTRIAALRDVFGSQLSVSGFSASPALPTGALTSQGFTTLLNSPDGFGRDPADDRPRTALGDVEAGITVLLLQSGKGSDHPFSLWTQGLVRLPNGSLPRAKQLFDQGTGDRQFDAEVSGIVDVGRGPVGLRSEVTYTRQFAKVYDGVIGRPDQLLLPTYRAAALSRDLGDIISVTARPYYRMAPHLAISGMASYWRKGSDRYSYAAGQDAIVGASLAELETGTAADALRLGLGLSYVHEGELRNSRMTMPVEAGFSLERTVSSSRGIVVSPLTTRMTFRVYKSLFTH